MMEKQCKRHRYCKHLSKDQQSQLLDLLREFEDLFDGTLGVWNTEPVSFELKEGATPYHSRPYPVPKAQKAVLIKELERLTEIGVVELAARFGMGLAVIHTTKA
eukprot:scaffold2043_cov39-Cyclotella_meneghiniana.AAC.3